MKTHISKRNSALIVLLSLLAHSIIFIALFMITFPHYEPSPKDPFFIVELEDRPQATTNMDLTAAAAQPSPAVQTPKAPTPPTPAPTPLAQAALNQMPAIMPASTPKKIPAPEKAPQKNSEPQYAPTEKPHEDVEEIKQEALDETIALATQFLDFVTPKKQNETPKKEPVKKESLKEQAKDNQPKDVLAHHEVIEKKQPSLPSLAQLTQSFMDHMDQDNSSDDINSPMAVKSNKRGKASMEQIQHLNYCHKIIGCLVTSYKINKGAAPKEQTNSACVQIALNQDGTINSLTLLQSSGNPTLDRFIIDMFKDASSSFPPVPASFKQTPYPLPLFNIENMQSFQSTQGWYIDNHTS